MQYWYKKAEFDADLESVETVAKRLLQKKLSAKNWQKEGVFVSYYCVKRLSAYNFFWIDCEWVSEQTFYL